MNKWISTKEAMKVLGVGSTTIKRWADEDTLPSRRTAGGHRRFRREAIDRLLRRQAAVGKESPTGGFFDLLIEESDILRIRDRIIQLRDQLGDWYRAADHLDNVMVKIWSDRPHDDESNAKSHVAAGRLGLALSAISKSLAVESAAPIVLMANFGGLQLSHRLALIELCVRSEGMEVLRAQQKTSTRELTAQIQSWNQRLILLAAAEHCNECDLLATAYHAISTACQEQGVELAIGFGGNMPDGAGYGYHYHSFGDLKDVLQRVKRDTETAPNK